jgi:muramoyltetrapeptide carboxypeptidase
MMPSTKSGFTRFRPVGPGSRIALVAPASPFDRRQFEAGVIELRRLGFDPVFEDQVFEREAVVAGSATSRARALQTYWDRPDIDALLAVRGGYGSVETLPLLDPVSIRASRKAFVGYSDTTSLHVFLQRAGLASVHGPMIEGRMSVGPSAYDPATFLASLSTRPLGALRPDGLQSVRAGTAAGPLVGGTLTQLTASFGTPFAFDPPTGHILLLDEVGERPYRLRRMVTQLALSGALGRAAAIVIGQLPGCDEPGGAVSGLGVIADLLTDFPGPVLAGFPTGHATSPLISLPLGVEVCVVGGAAPVVIVEEAAAA